MAVGKEIRGKIKSFENTKKITKAMEMVAASKMRKAQERMRAARPYADKIRNITANLSQANPEYKSAYLRKTAEGQGAKAVILSFQRETDTPAPLLALAECSHYVVGFHKVQINRLARLGDLVRFDAHRSIITRRGGADQAVAICEFSACGGQHLFG